MKNRSTPVSGAQAEDAALHPFRHGWRAYRQAGWPGTLPLPPLAKKYPPRGVTGRRGIDPDDAQLARWAADADPRSNIGLRLPPDVIGIDMDQYLKGLVQRLGADFVAKLERKLGALPPTWSSTRRDPGGPSRILFFRVPPGVEFRGDLGDKSGVEIIWHGYRYAVVWPSVVHEHDDTRTGDLLQYAWFDPTGALAHRIPSPGKLAELPPAWVEHLRAPERADEPVGLLRECTEPEGTDAALALLDRACETIADAVEGDRNKTANREMYHMARLVAGGELAEDYTKARLTDAASQCGLDPDETEGVLGSAFTAAEAKPRQLAAVPDTPAVHAEADQDPDLIQRTQLGAARRLRNWYGQDVRFVLGRGWLCWDGRRWVEDAARPRQIVNELSDRMIRAARQMPKGEDKTEALQHACSLQKASGARGVLDQASNLAGVRVLGTEFDADPYKLLVGNGVVDLKTGELLPNRREYLITKGTTIDYAPDDGCPQWTAFLNWASRGDDQLVDYIQRMFGEILIGHNNGQRVYFLYGPGGNGKTQLIEVMGGVVGDYYTVALPDLLTAQAAATHTEGEANLAGARMVAISETRKGQVLDESRVNRLSGEKTQRASRKGEKAFEFPTTFTMVIYGNIRPTIPFTEGVARRMKVIRMDAKVDPAKRVDDLSGHLLREEGPAILAWAVRGAVRVASGERVGDPPVVTEAVQEWKRENNPFGEFAEERLEVDPNGRITNAELWGQYKVWTANGGRDFASNTTALGQRLVEWAADEDLPEFVARAKIGKRKTRGFKGLRVLSE